MTALNQGRGRSAGEGSQEAELNAESERQAAAQAGHRGARVSATQLEDDGQPQAR